MSEVRLKRCPFCGSKCRVESEFVMGGRNKNKYRVKYFAYCGCGARGPVATARREGFNPLSEADHKKAFWKDANLWNSRKEL